MKFRTKYSRKRVFSPAGSKSMTDQQYKDECSIDAIIKKYGIMGQPVPQPFGTGGDVSELGDFASVMQKVAVAREQFMDLPSEIRARFGHSPEAFYNWLADSKNTEEAVKLGLLIPREVEKDPVEVLERIAANTSPKEEAKQS